MYRDLLEELARRLPQFVPGELWGERNYFERWYIGDGGGDAPTSLFPPAPPVARLTTKIRSRARDVVDMLGEWAVPYFQMRDRVRRAPRRAGQSRAD